MCYQLANFTNFVKYLIHLTIELHTSTKFLGIFSLTKPEKEIITLTPI